MRKNRAFTLVELLVVVSIISILAITAIPAYKKYAIRARVSELFSLAQGYKVQALTEDKLFIKDYPDSRYVESVTIDAQSDPSQAVIELVAKMRTVNHQGIGLTMPDNLDKPLTIRLTSNLHAKNIDWSCATYPEYKYYVPSICDGNILE